MHVDNGQYFLYRLVCRIRRLPGVVLELALHHQGMGAGRRAAPRPHDSNREGRWSPACVLAGRDALSRAAPSGHARRPAAGHHHARQRHAEGERGRLFRVVDRAGRVVEVENYLYATSQLAQTTLRSVLGQAELDELLAQREQLNASSRTSSISTPSRGA